MEFRCDNCNTSYVPGGPIELWDVFLCPRCRQACYRVPETTGGISNDVLAGLAPEELERLSFASKGAQYPPAYRILWRAFQRLAKERAETVAKLRELTEELEDTEWPESLHLADVLEKHLWRHLAEEDWPPLSVEGRKR